MSRWRRNPLNEVDQAFSEWHRHALPDEFAVIDIDFCEYCRECRQPIALIEAARDISGRGYFKQSYVTKSLAEQAGVSAYIVLWKPAEGHVTPEYGLGFIESAWVRRIEPEPQTQRHYDERGLVNFYRWLRAIHRCRELGVESSSRVPSSLRK